MLLKFNRRKAVKILLSLVLLLSFFSAVFPNASFAQMPGCTPSFSTKPMVAAGDNHSVYLKSDGTVWSWGQNNSGQLGNGTTAETSPIVQVSGLCDVLAIAAGTGNGVALKSDGTVWAWGGNNNGQLGNGTTNDSAVPVQVSNLSDVAAIAAGLGYNVALKKDGTVWTWGNNSWGQLGYDTAGSNNSKVPQQVSGLTGITSISAGFNHAAAVWGSGTVWTWGDNSNSQLGRNTSPKSFDSTPAQVPGLSAVKTISLGLHFSVALLQDGTVRTWGFNNVGQLGNGTRTTSVTPVQVLKSSNPQDILTNVTAVEAGYEHTMALLNDGSVHVWGTNQERQIGDGITGGWRLFATKSNQKGTAVAVSAGRAHSLAVRTDGTVWSWGGNSYYQLGRFTEAFGASYGPSSTPGQVFEGLVDCTTTTSFTTMPMVAAGEKHSVVLKPDGTVWAWGNNEFGQIGNGQYGDNVAPVQVPGMCYITAIAAGFNFTLALRIDGTVWVWGDNANGQLGNGTSGPGSRSPVPVRVTDLLDVTAISAGEDFAMALKKDGTVWTWGANNYGQLGYISSGGIGIKPRQINELGSFFKVKAIAAQYEHAAALTTDGTVWTWGSNSGALLGYPTNSLVNPDPRHVPGLSNVDTIASGAGMNTVIQKRDGTVWDWGSNTWSSLGNGTRGGNPAVSPVKVLTAANMGLQHVSSVTAGSAFAIALIKDGTLRGWGFNSNGQLGIGSYEYDLPFAQRLLMKNVLSVAAGYAHAIAIKKDGTVWSWGINNNYQLGRNSSSQGIPTHTPAPVEGLEAMEIPPLINALPLNVELVGTVGKFIDNTPAATTVAPITVNAFFDDPVAVKVTLLATDAAGHTYEAQMTKVDGENWSHTFLPKAVGLTASPLKFQLIPQYVNNTNGAPINFAMKLLDPSGIVYNSAQGGPDAWPLPDATVVLQYFDPDRGAAGEWVEINADDYPGRFLPVTNPELTGADGRFAWDTAAGQYRVVVSRSGFATAVSRVVSVPPAVLDLHVGLMPTDTLKPTLSVSGLAAGAAYSQPVTVEWQASDDLDDASGIRYVEYQLDAAAATRVYGDSGSFFADAPGTHHVHFTVVDHAGNAYTESIPFTITPPEQLSHTVTFNSNGGSPVNSLTVEKGSAATQPTDPVRTRYSFAGWYSDSGLTSAFDFATPITGNITLYAKWNSSNADLSGLVVSDATLTPVFSSGTMSYTASVDSIVSSIKVTATVTAAVYTSVTASVYDNNGTLTDGPFYLTSGTASPSLPLNAGSSVIKVNVTAQDGAIKTYTVTVLRLAPPTSTPPAPTNIAVINNTSPTPDTVTVLGLTVGDIIKVYDNSTSGNLLGQSVPVPSGNTTATVTVNQLGTGSGTVYVSVMSTGKTESLRIAKAYDSEPAADTIAPVTLYHFDPIYETSRNGTRYIKGFTVTLRATDNQSGTGVKTTQYRINGGTWITYTVPFTVTAGVTHTVEYFSTDQSGNPENPMNLMDFDKGIFTGAGKF